MRYSTGNKGLNGWTSIGESSSIYVRNAELALIAIDHHRDPCGLRTHYLQQFIQIFLTRAVAVGIIKDHRSSECGDLCGDIYYCILVDRI